LQCDHNDWVCIRCVEEMFPFASIEDDVEYLSSLLMHAYGLRAAGNIVRTHDQLSLMTKSLKFDKDLDPGRNCLNLNKVSNYVTEVDFNSSMSKNCVGSKFSVLRMLVIV